MIKRDPFLPTESAVVRIVTEKVPIGVPSPSDIEGTMRHWDAYRAKARLRLRNMTRKEKQRVFRDAVYDMPSSKRLAEIETAETLARERAALQEAQAQKRSRLEKTWRTIRKWFQGGL